MLIGKTYVSLKYYFITAILISIIGGIISLQIRNNFFLVAIIFNIIAFTGIGYFNGRTDELIEKREYT